MENHDDSSHYEISLTAGQAFIAFVLLLFSLAAAFAFGIIVGKGQFDDAAAATAAPIQEARVADLGGSVAAEKPEPVTPSNPPVIIEEAPPPPIRATPSDARAVPIPIIEPAAVVEPVPYFAQLLSTGDSRAAEDLAARLIEAGFSSAYVERTNSPRGMVHRVRVRFPSEADAREAVKALKKFAAGELWIARQ